MVFSERLMLMRKKKKVSQEELAKAIGVHAPVIGRYERGEVKPSIEVATRMAEALQVSLDYLVGFTDLELDMALTQKISEIQKLDAGDKNLVLRMVEVLMQELKQKRGANR